MGWNGPRVGMTQVMMNDRPEAGICGSIPFEINMLRAETPGGVIICDAPRGPSRRDASAFNGITD